MQKVFFFPRFRLFTRMIVGFLLIAVLSPAAFASLNVHATGGQASFSLQPVLYDPSDPVTKSYFVFNSHPGTTLDSRLRVTNNGTEQGTVLLYAVDATTGQTSGTVYLSRNDGRKDVGAWVTLGVQSLTLDAGASEIIPFQVAIPTAIWPGQHVGGIVAESTVQVSSSNSSALKVNVQNLAIVAVEVNLPGTPIEQLEATGIQIGGANNYQSLQVGLANTGTMILKPYGTLQVSDSQGHLLRTLPLTLDTFLPKTSINYPVYIQGQALGPGNYQALLILNYGHDHILTYSTAFEITQQQLTQIFNSKTTTQLPGSGQNFFDKVSPWLFVGNLLLVFSLASIILFLRVKAQKQRQNRK